jgi:LmbE family N-acetylglucosaminyl deacetylase
MKRLITALRTKFSKKRYQCFAIGATTLAMGSLFFYFTQVPQVAAQAAVRQLHEVAAPARGQKVLVFSPHPDDETIAVGGYIAQGIRNGADVRIVLVTDGDKHHQKAIRYAEFEKATGILGVPQANLIFLNFPDGRLSSENQTVLSASLRAQIGQYSPRHNYLPASEGLQP